MKTVRTLVLLVCAASLSRAASITLVSQVGGTYQYALTTGVGEVLTFEQGDFIMLSNMFGITGAATSDDLGIFTGVAFTPTSVTLTIAPPPFQFVSFGSEATYQLLTVTSSVTTLGNVNFTLDSATRINAEGLVLGPVRTDIPEPATAALFAIGFAGWLAFRLRR
jgi:hypothetical protein